MGVKNRQIGIFANVVEQERTLVEQRRAANELQIFFWQNDGTDELYLYPYHALPVADTSGTGPAIGNWYASGGTAGIEPTDPKVKEVLDLFGIVVDGVPVPEVAVDSEE